MARRWMAPLLLLLLFGGIYGWMAPPGLDWGDSGEAQLAAAVAGLSHPTGYPLYLILGWLWTRLLALGGIPPARAMTLLSVWTAALAVALTVPMMRALLRRLRIGAAEPVAVTTALFVALSHTFWSQAIIAEVYALNLLLLVLLLCGLWSEGARTRLPWLALLYGLALGHHRTALLWAPGLLLWLWLEQRESLRRGRWALLLAMVALPQLLYLYVPWRGPLTPYLHQRLDETTRLVLYDGSAAAFLTHISGTAFAGELTLAGLFGAGARRMGRLVWSNLTLLPLFWLFWLARGALGRWRRADLYLLGLTGGAILLFGLVFGVGDVDVMLVPLWFSAIVIGMGSWAATLEARRGPPRQGMLWLVAAALLLPQALSAPPSLRQRVEPRRLATTLLEAAPADAILLSTDRNEMVPLWYLQFVEGRRPDVLALFPLVTPAPEHATMAALTGWALEWERPLLLARDVPELAPLYELRPTDGPLVEVVGQARPPVGAVVQSEMGAGMRAVGWALTPARPSAGSRPRVEIALALSEPLEDDTYFSLQLFDDQGSRLAQQELAPGLDFLPSEWPVGRPLRLLFSPELPDRLPDGVLEWRLSSYRPAGTTLEPIGRQIVVGRSVAPPQALVEVTGAPLARWEDGIVLLEVEPPAPPGVAGAPVHFNLIWGAVDGPDRSYTQYVHLLDEAGVLVTQSDRPPNPPTDTWLAGDRWVEMQALQIPAGTPAGRYRVRVGLYFDAGRLPLQTGEDGVDLFEIEVTE